MIAAPILKVVLTFFLALYLFAFSLSSALANVTPESCLDINRSVAVSMLDAMVNDFGIQQSELIIDKTQLSLLYKQKVTSQIADFYAKDSYNNEAAHFFSESKYKELYLESNAQNIIVKYDFVNAQNKHNITIASLLVNDDECSIRFNGYIVVKREF
ncbi:hypothetical protein [Mixta sp. Marseille-Q2659]|uniref:hypothetical protein n=1 Tax=Mixta sp. Marseille-Q2659 TaxID=2736607 RepID=UPI0023B9B16C|nr:hypothetical protein [Mixta sp. Marseille-Q2659]